MSGEELIDAARALEKKLLNFFWRQGVPMGEGEDLVQETYLRLWKYRDRYEPTAGIATFVFMVARQVRIDALRRQTRSEKREETWQKERPEVQEPDSWTAEYVRWAVAQLPEQMREVVEFGVFQDLPYEEVGKILDIPVGTVKSRMFNAIRKLKELTDDKRS